jgi:diaminohydroxyphosphoribosylaminopyrimidine deaminase/5-amino-6-(5-phosphoribosylamino)uracil reductase
LFKEPEEAKIFTSKKIAENNIEIGINSKGDLSLKEISTFLYTQNIGSLLVEGGGKLIQSYLETDLWDELRIIRTEKKLVKGKKIQMNGLEKSQSFFLGKDLIEIYFNLKLHQIT